MPIPGTEFLSSNQQAIGLTQGSENFKLKIQYDKPAAGSEKCVPKNSILAIWQKPTNFNILASANI